MAEETVTVWITAEQRVDYRQYKTMTRSEWETLKRTPERKLEDRDGPLSDLLELDEVHSASNFEDVEMIVVGKDCKPVFPADSYTGDEDDGSAVEAS